jgi:DNA polymerase III delta subunit
MKKKDSDNYIILGQTEKAEEVKLYLINKYLVEDFDIKTLFAGEMPIGKILEETEFLPLFSRKKILFVKNIERFLKADCEILKEYFDRPSPNTCLIMTGKSIKAPMDRYVDVSAEKDLSGLFPMVFRMATKSDGERLLGLFKDYLKNNEKDFAAVINAAVIYLRNVVKRQKGIDRETLNKYRELQKLDFNLKTGQIHPGTELEIFLYYLFI